MFYLILLHLHIIFEIFHLHERTSLQQKAVNFIGLSLILHNDPLIPEVLMYNIWSFDQFFYPIIFNQPTLFGFRSSHI